MVQRLQHCFSHPEKGTQNSPYPEENNSFTLDTDACGTGIGAFLSQFKKGQPERVSAYHSKSLSKAEGIIVSPDGIIGRSGVGEALPPLPLRKEISSTNRPWDASMAHQFLQPRGC